jgi:hypothetical protein
LALALAASAVACGPGASGGGRAAANADEGATSVSVFNRTVNATLPDGQVVSTPNNPLSDPSTCGDGLGDLLDSHPGGGFFQKTPEEQRAAASAPLRARNPLLTAAQDVQCLGCHAAPRALGRARGSTSSPPG